VFKKLLSLLSDAAIYGVSSALSQLISFFLLPIFTRQLTPADYGVLGMLGIVNLLFVPIATTGMTGALFRRFNAEKTPEKKGAVLSSALASVAASSLLLLLILFFAAPAIAAHLVGDPRTSDLVQLTLVSSAIAAISGIELASLRAARRVKTVSALTLLKLLSYVTASVFFVVYLKMGVRGAVLGTLLAEIFFIVAQTVVTYRSFLFRPEWSTWAKMAWYGLPIVPHAVQAFGLILFGQYMVRQQLGLGEAGLYNVAVKFAVPASFIIGSIQTAWTAYKFQVHEEDPDSEGFFRSTMTYYVAGTSYLWIGVAAWGPELLRVLTPHEYHAAAWLVPAAAFVPIAQGVYFMFSTGIELSDNTRPFPLISFLGLLTVVTGTFAVVPHFGSAGALVITGVGWIVMACCMFWFAQRRLTIRYDWASIRVLWASAIALVVLIYLGQQHAWSSRLGLALLVTFGYPLVPLVVLFRSQHERERISILLDKFHLTKLATRWTR